MIDVCDLERPVPMPRSTLFQLPIEWLTRRQVVLMEDEITRAQRLVVQRTENFILQVKDFMPAEILDKDRAFRVLKRLVNFSPLKIECARLKSSTTRSSTFMSLNPRSNATGDTPAWTTIT
jgi:hypothetical protein